MVDDTIIPRALKKGDTIAFVSPSTRFNDVYPAALARAEKYLEGLGFKIKLIYSPIKGTLIEQVRQRTEELHEAFRDPEVKAIICTSGGNHANELSRHLDYGLIRANPKIFCGYSDITNLHGALLTQARLRTFYGPTVIINFGDVPKPLDFTVDHLMKVLHDAPGEPVGPFPRSQGWAKELPSFCTSGDQASEVPRALSPSPAWTWLRPGRATGRIFGGVLTSFLELAGTKYWPDLSGAILLIESSFGNNIGDPVPLQKTRFQLGDLANLGVFDQINGLVFGRPVGQSEEMDKELAEVLLYQCHGTSFPILMNVDVGHTDPMLTIPLYSMVSLDSERDEWTCLEPGVK